MIKLLKIKNTLQTTYDFLMENGAMAKLIAFLLRISFIWSVIKYIQILRKFFEINKKTG